MPDVHAYGEALADFLAPGFALHELVRNGSPRLALPPEKFWHRMAPTLLLANELRRRMKEHGAKGLRVNAAYRPNGGAPSSQHKANRALDLDLIPGDYDKARVYYEEAVKLWCEAGCEQEVGLGLYCPRDVQAGIRVHLDTGFRTRTWQHGANSGVADAKLIAKRLGLTLPGELCEDEGSEMPQ